MRDAGIKNQHGGPHGHARPGHSGKPAIVQSTGFESRLPTWMGLLTFRTLEEAAGHIRAVNADYLAHCRAARPVAEEYFDSDKVLSSALSIADVD